MTWEQISLLLPIILVSAAAVLTMLMIAVKRSHAMSCLMTALGLALALVSLFAVAPVLQQQVTPLLLIDAFNGFFTALILLTAIFITLFSYPYMSNLEQPQEFYLLISLATLGALVMAGSNHFVSAFLGIEILSVSLYGMIAYPLHRPVAAQYPLEASIKYLVLSAVSTGFILFGLALLYAQTGTLSFSSITALAADAATGPGSAYFGVASVLILAGFAFKLSLVPFHLWTPDVYEGSPLPATAFLATIGKAAMVALLVRFLLLTDIAGTETAVTVIAVLAAASILAGNLLALLQSNLKRLLAYSSVAHMGYLLIALIGMDASADAIGQEAILFYLSAYVLTTMGAFGVMMLVSDSGHERDHLNHYQGLFWRSPWLATVFTAMLLSLAGIPLTVGFIGKFYIVVAIVENGLWWLLAALVTGSGIGLYYYLRVIYRMLMPLTDTMDLPEVSLRDFVPHALLFALLLGVIILGVAPGILIDHLAEVAQSMN